MSSKDDIHTNPNNNLHINNINSSVNLYFTSSKSARPISASLKFNNLGRSKMGNFNMNNISQNNFMGKKTGFNNLNHNNSKEAIKRVKSPTPFSAVQTVEKEKLYENCIHLKNTLNSMNKELHHFRSEVHKRDIELNKQNKMMQDIFHTNNIGNFENNSLIQSQQINLHKLRETNLLNNVRNQYKELKREFKEKEVELESLKKTLKSCKIKELQVENQTLLEEMSKLRSSYESLQSQSSFNE
jgi:hypothetical protein